jgi:mRNA interferase RelE/StbE
MWEVEYTKRFLKELSELPENIQGRVEAIVFEALKSENPFNLGYIEKLKGYADKYKIRVGDYRVGIAIDTVGKRIICQRLAHRREIYRIFP